MNKRFYPRLAARNLGKNRRFYLPYLLTVMGTAAAFYMMSSTTRVDSVSGLETFVALQTILWLGVIVVAIVSGLFLLYTNSFLTKQRGREFALYSILGMSKRNITRVLLWETIYTAVIGIFGGLIAGAVFDRLMLMLLCRLIGVGFSGPAVYWDCAARTAIWFAALLFVAFLITGGRVHLSQPAALLHAENAGEREPRARWLLALLGLAALGAGYYIAIATKSPLQALLLFFVAVLLVIAGTFLLFLSGSVTVLKLLRRNKRYYYRTRHFISVSGLMYRMKRNAAGLAVICILSTAVLVMVSSTVSLYAGIEAAARTQYPRELMTAFGSHDRDERSPDAEAILGFIREWGFHPERVQAYDALGTSGMLTKNGFSCDQKVLASGWDVELGVKQLFILPAADYEAVGGGEAGLAQGQALLRNGFGLAGDIDVFGRSLTVVGEAAGADFIRAFEAGNAAVDTVTLVVPEADFFALYEAQRQAYEDAASEIMTHVNFDLPDGESASDCLSIVRELYRSRSRVENTGWRSDFEHNMRALFGGLLYLGMFLGVLFLAGTVLIIYHKQISEGYEDQRRFEIMQQVGLSRPEAAGAIRSQILLVFFLPLGTAVLHMAAAGPLITRLLRAFEFTNTGLFIWCAAASAAAFAAIYTVVYAVTARTYYRIVSGEGTETREN